MCRSKKWFLGHHKQLVSIIGEERTKKASTSNWKGRILTSTMKPYESIELIGDSKYIWQHIYLHQWIYRYAHIYTPYIYLHLYIFLEKAMAPHSSSLAWKIPWMEEPGGLQSMGSLRVGHDWATSLSHFTFLHWRRKWQPTPVFLPGESQGRGSLVGCRLWGRTESDTTEVT